MLSNAILKKMLPSQAVRESVMEECLAMPLHFGYHGNKPIGETWSIGPCIETRDSELISQSNSEVIQQLFDELVDSEDWEILECQHWAYGWVNHLSFRVKDEEGKPTDAIKLWLLLQDAIKEYPILDEENLHEKEYAAMNEDINWFLNHTSEVDLETLPDNAELRIHLWLSARDIDWDESDGYNGSDMEEAAKSLGYLKEEA